MEHQNQPGFYQTGYTQPPKSYRGFIAVLLIIIVLLGSVATMLGLLNIRLFHKLSMQSEEASSVQFTRSADTGARALSADSNCLGLSVKTISVFDQNFYQLPQGVYITNVAPGSSAAVQGILPGDVLISVQNIPLADVNDLEAYLHTCIQGQLVKMVIFRDGKQYTFTLTTGDNK